MVLHSHIVAQPTCNMQTAEVRMSKKALSSMAQADSLIVQMPSGFCADGDAGSIGRFVTPSSAIPEALQINMDIKGICHNHLLGCESVCCWLGT